MWERDLQVKTFVPQNFVCLLSCVLPFHSGMCVLFLGHDRGEAAQPTPVLFGFEAVSVTVASKCFDVCSSTPPAPFLRGHAYQYFFPGKSSKASNPSPL